MSSVFRVLWVVTPCLMLLATAACGSETETTEEEAVGESDAAAAEGEDAGVADAATEPSSRMNAEALEELREVGLDAFLGVAVVAEETTNGDVTSFTFDPDSGPICMRGSEFRAHIRDAGSDSLVFFLDGGGACWTGLCMADAEADPSLIPYALMDDTNDENVAKDWNLVYVPYCDGSVFAGANQLEDGEGMRYHHGRQNLSAAVDLATEHFPDMQRIIVTGVSGGGFGTLSAMGLIRMAYPQAELFVINDSGPGLQSTTDTQAVQTRLDEWRFQDVVPPSCVECDGGRGQMMALVAWGLENDPTLKTALLSYYEDIVIGFSFLGLLGPAYKEVLLEESGKIHEQFPDRFKRFMLPGPSHVIMADFYGAEIEGVTLAQWVRAMVEGDDDVWRDLLAPEP